MIARNLPYCQYNSICTWMCENIPISGYCYNLYFLNKKVFLGAHSPSLPWTSLPLSEKKSSHSSWLFSLSLTRSFPKTKASEINFSDQDLSSPSNFGKTALRLSARKSLRCPFKAFWVKHLGPNWSSSLPARKNSHNIGWTRQSMWQSISLCGSHSSSTSISLKRTQLLVTYCSQLWRPLLVAERYFSISNAEQQNLLCNWL